MILRGRVVLKKERGMEMDPAAAQKAIQRPCYPNAPAAWTMLLWCSEGGVWDENFAKPGALRCLMTVGLGHVTEESTCYMLFILLSMVRIPDGHLIWVSINRVNPGELQFKLVSGAKNLSPLAPIQCRPIAF